MKKKALLLAALCAAQISSAASKEKEAPGWVNEVATRAMPAYSGRVPAVYLLKSQVVTVDASGTIDTVSRCAIKILTYDGKRQAEVVEAYEKGGRQVKELHAWLVAPGGFVKTFEKNNVEDLGAYSDELYNDFRLRRIRADNAEIGAVFVYESEVVEKALQAQDRFAFQTALPSVDSRYSITVPAGWTVSGLMLNHAPVTPVVSGDTYTWTLQGLPFRTAEEAAPHLYGTTPMLAVDFQPPPGVSGPPTFKTWSDVSRWHASIAEPQGEVTPEMTAKVRELTSGASNEYDKIRAICRYVQQFRYVEIAVDFSHNGGVRPHPASQVFAKQYGDCKDKANLLQAMLKSAGVPSYLTIIFSGDRTFVKKDWASPSQFNHMILAIQVSDAVNTPTILATKLGRLLLFDPTDNKTPIGDLPFYEQGSYALICDGARGDLFQMPVVLPERSLLTQTVQATIDETGKLTASLAMQSAGQAARNERQKHDVPPDQYMTELQRYLDYYVKGASVAKVEAHDAFDQNTFSASYDFGSARYAQLMQGRLLIFNPVIIRPPERQFPVEKERRQAIVLNGRVYRRQISIKLPNGFKVDELPTPYKAEEPFATFSVAYRQEAGQIVVNEELRTEAVTLPATDYPRVKKFFDNALAADNQNAVLVKN